MEPRPFPSARPAGAARRRRRARTHTQTGAAVFFSVVFLWCFTALLLPGTGPVGFFPHSGCFVAERRVGLFALNR